MEADSVKNRIEYAKNATPGDLTKKEKKRRHSSSDSQSDSSVEETRKDKTPCPKQQSTKRDDWMSLPTNFASFSNVDKKKSREEEKKMQKEKDVYDPSKCPRELNLYWKNGGDGLPKFQKPSDDSHR